MCVCVCESLWSLQLFYLFVTAIVWRVGEKGVTPLHSNSLTQWLQHHKWAHHTSHTFHPTHTSEQWRVFSLGAGSPALQGLDIRWHLHKLDECRLLRTAVAELGMQWGGVWVA